MLILVYNKKILNKGVSNRMDKVRRWKKVQKMSLMRQFQLLIDNMTKNYRDI